MSHHVTATASNPSGAVEVVRVQSTAAAAAPLDLGSTGSGGLVKTSTTQVEGASKTVGANLPVDNIEQASNSIQNAKHDLAATAGAETRLNGLDGVGGGGGGGGGAGAGQENANNAQGAVAQDNPDVNQLKTQTNLANAPDPGTGGTGTTTGAGTTTPAGATGATGTTATAVNAVGVNGLPETDVRSTAV